jgi:hypothetical protein
VTLEGKAASDGVLLLQAAGWTPDGRNTMPAFMSYEPRPDTVCMGGRRRASVYRSALVPHSCRVRYSLWFGYLCNISCWFIGQQGQGRAEFVVEARHVSVLNGKEEFPLVDTDFAMVWVDFHYPMGPYFRCVSWANSSELRSLPVASCACGTTPDAMPCSHYVAAGTHCGRRA